MKNDLILKVEDISKQYRLGVRGTGTVSHDLNRWWAKMRGKEDPFLTLGETNDRSTKGNSEYVWALYHLSQHYSRNFETLHKAHEYICKSIQHTNTVS